MGSDGVLSASFQRILLYARAQVPDAVQAAEGGQVVNRSSVASLAFLVYDVLLTFDEEVHLIWSKPWNLIKFTFFFIRYVPILVQISILFIGTELTPHFHFTSHDCYIWQVYQCTALMAIIIAADTILLLRCFALYSGNRIVHSIVIVLFFLEIIGMCTGFALALPSFQFNNICLVTDIGYIIALYYASSMAFQIVLFSLTLYKFIVAVRAGWGSAPLVVLVVRDGAWAFCLLLLVELLYAIMFALPSHAYVGVLYGWLLTAFSFSGYRVLLNLYHFSESSNLDTLTNAHSTHLSTHLDFTSHIVFTDITGTNDSYELAPMTPTRARHRPHLQDSD